MDNPYLPVFLLIACSAAVAVGMLVVGRLFGPSRTSPVKEMPYESGMDPIHDTRRRFDVRFHLVAIAFLIFDVELLFIYPWAVASRNSAGIDSAVTSEWVSSRGLVFGGVMFFVLLVGEDEEIKFTFVEASRVPGKPIALQRD